MVRRKLREKSEKKKINVKGTQPIAINASTLSRGQRKRLINKTHVLAKKSLDVLSLLKNPEQKQRIESSIEEFSVDAKNNDQKKTKKGAPKNQQKRNEMLFIEMQRYQNVITNDKVKEDPYAAVRQYLDAKLQSQ